MKAGKYCLQLSGSFAIMVRLLLACVVAVGTARAQELMGAPANAPNVIIILIDDSGFSDASAFGGTAETPFFDKLATQGLRYNHFHTTGICTATRGSLLTGLNHHKAGFGTLSDVPGQSPGYNTRWKKNAPSIAKILQRNGYSTAAIGKWHNTPWKDITPAGPYDRWPNALGFDYFYGFMQPGASSLWEPHSMYRNTTPVDPTVEQGEGYHLSTDLTDDAIRWIQTQSSVDSEKPYFLYVAHGAVHFPHHVPKKWIEKYRGKFDQGWDLYREEVFVRQKKLGVIPPDTKLTPRPEELVAWESLTPDQKRFYAHEMEVYAGLVDHTDYEIGRLLKAVQEGPDGDNTLIFYIVGDNGGSGGAGAGNNVPERMKHMDEMGGPLHLNGIEQGWAWAVSTPFQWFKSFASHFGATRNPLVVSWPARIKDAGGLRTQFTHVNAIAATIYDCVGIDFPSFIDGLTTIPLDGVSFKYTFDSPKEPSRHRTQYFEMFGNRSIYHDGWVAAARHTDLSYRGPAGDVSADRWELYHVAADFSEAMDLASRHPEKLRELKALFESEARKNDVYPIGERGDRGDAYSGPGYDPSVTGETVVYHAGLPRVLGISAPNFLRSHRITAEVVTSDNKTSGVLVSWGSRWSGFALYVKEGRLVYESIGSGNKRTVITSDVPLPLGEATVTLEFENESSSTATWGANSVGNARIFINGKLVGNERVEISGSSAFWGSFGVGKAFGSPVSPAFQPPFEFTGTLSKVTVEIK